MKIDTPALLSRFELLNRGVSSSLSCSFYDSSLFRLPSGFWMVEDDGVRDILGQPSLWCPIYAYRSWSYLATGQDNSGLDYLILFSCFLVFDSL